MFESKYSKVLTVILIIVILAIIGLLGFLAYDYFQKYSVTTDTADFVDNFEGDVQVQNQTTNNTRNNTENNEDEGEEEEDPFSQIQQVEAGSSGNSTSKTKVTYKGYGVLGTMEIPATNFKYPILEPNVTTGKLNTSVVFLYGTGLNQPGNSVIVGHNYRNGLFFSNNKKLNIGDKIYITDNDGTKLTYTIYNKFQTTPEDTSFYQRDTDGKAEVTLSTCTDDSKARIIILARAE